MHWWKKFLSNFFSEKTLDEPADLHIEDKHKNEQQEMKTRMIYQYPKGEFRFPLIKDQPGSPAPGKRMPAGREQADAERRRESRQITQKSRKKTEPASRKIEPKNSQPFEPTHIPSPIYGFNRPMERRTSPAIPEIELRGFETDTRFEKDEQVTETANSDTGREEGLSYSQTEEEHPAEFELEKAGPEHEESSKYNIRTWTQNVKSEEEAGADEAETSETLHIDSHNKGEAYEEEQLSDQEVEMVISDEEESAVKEEPQVSDRSGIESEPEFISEEPVCEEETTVSMEIFSNTATILEEKEAAAEETSDEKTEVVQPSMEESKKEEPAQEKTGSRPRSHLPFNVLMLTQDRNKWQRQREREKRQIEERPAQAMEGAEAETAATAEPETVHYEFPSLQLLKPPVIKAENTEWLNEQTALLDETLENFNVRARVVKASQGPSVTRFEVQPDKGVKVNKITNLSNDIKLSMAARDIRMEAPIPGTRSIGIELPNKESRPVQISEIIGKNIFLQSDSPLTAVLGLDISGEPVVTDLRKMPHGLIAGATGSGKSVCINSILVSLLYKARPDELKLMLIDPKMVELAPYNHIPHLVSPVITDVKAATAALKWAVDEMERRYELFVHAGVRDIGRFNYLAKTKGQKSEHLPYIVIVIDELADLMMVAPAEVEESICRIAQKARACGIHLLIATQRPSVDVITGLIKANVPTRVAFSVSSQVDSRTVIDVSGAEKLLGRGDMLFLNNGSVKPVRLQGTFVSDEEIDRVIEHIRSQGKPNYLFQQEELLKKAEIQENEDELLLEACEFVVKQGNASTSLLQRQFRIGYNRAARLMEMMEEQGVISGAKGSKPRDVLIKEAELDLLKDSLVH